MQSETVKIKKQPLLLLKEVLVIISARCCLQATCRWHRLHFKPKSRPGFFFFFLSPSGGEERSCFCFRRCSRTQNKNLLLLGFGNWGGFCKYDEGKSGRAVNRKEGGVGNACMHVQLPASHICKNRKANFHLGKRGKKDHCV